jgi:hypothetical protein
MPPLPLQLVGPGAEGGEGGAAGGQRALELGGAVVLHAGEALVGGERVAAALQRPREPRVWDA